MGLDGCALMKADCFFEESGWLVPGLVGEVEGAPVDSEEMLRADVRCDLEGFGRVGVLRAHEPARGIGADGQHCNERGAAASADFGEDLAVLVSGVSGAVDAA